MEAAFADAERQPLSADQVGWKSVSVQLPLGDHLQEKPLVAVVKREDASKTEKLTAAKHLAWLRRSEAGKQIDIGCLRLAGDRVLHMPDELFVEYQLAAQQMRPDLFVAMASYGEYGAGYIGTEIAYDQGGYETSPRASRLGPGSAKALRNAMGKLLK